ncbi:hypothetical protein [Negadavirga shengliensis]|uniref:ABM domain-containing protein n=1 Tax=Negadavirga shengliensis TaxID=1389218 RepID=A0ABV9T386_9BACT
MYAVFRETYYSAETKIQETKAFKAFQDKHAEQPGYAGTIVTSVGEGRHLTVTLWKTKEDMHNARKTLGQVVEELLNPIMTAPAILLGTGPVVVNDLNAYSSG